MKESIEIFSEIFAVSLIAWGLFYLLSILRIKRFIVSRYKEESDIARTAFFSDHVPFVLYMPDYFAAGFFGTHLMMCVWGWRYFGKRRVFRDVDDPNIIIHHFSKSEIRKVKWVLISGLILFTHGTAYFIFKFIWPGIFG